MRVGSVHRTRRRSLLVWRKEKAVIHGESCVCVCVFCGMACGENGVWGLEQSARRM